MIAGWVTGCMQPKAEAQHRRENKPSAGCALGGRRAHRHDRTRVNAAKCGRRCTAAACPREVGRSGGDDCASPDQNRARSACPLTHSAADGRWTVSGFLRKRWPIVAGAVLVAALTFLGVRTAVTGGGGNGLTPGQWVLVSAVPTSSNVEILAVEGGCRRFDHLDVSYGRQAIAITTWDKVWQGVCPADLSFEPRTVSLPGPIGSRQIVGACPASIDAQCAEAEQVAAASSAPATSS
jgi:hypothetical protein